MTGILRERFEKKINQVMLLDEAGLDTLLVFMYRGRERENEYIAK